jgi:hypothetical protein
LAELESGAIGPSGAETGPSLALISAITT